MWEWNKDYVETFTWKSVLSQCNDITERIRMNFATMVKSQISSSLHRANDLEANQCKSPATFTQLRSVVVRSVHVKGVKLNYNVIM